MSCCALNYPERDPTSKQKQDTTNYLYSLMNILCCSYCRDSSLEYIDSLPPEPFLDDRAGFCVFVYLFKSLVNRKLKKPDCTFIEFITAHEQYRAKCSSKQGLGCTVPAEGKCPEEIAVWCEKALQKYSNYQERIDDWRRQQSLQKLARWSAYVIGCIILLWLILPRIRQILKRSMP